MWSWRTYRWWIRALRRSRAIAFAVASAFVAVGMESEYIDGGYAVGSAVEARRMDESKIASDLAGTYSSARSAARAGARARGPARRPHPLARLSRSTPAWHRLQRLPRLRARGQTLTSRGCRCYAQPPFKRAEIKVSGTFQGKKFAPQWLVARDRLAPAGAPLPSLRVARGGRRAWSLARHTTAERMDALLGYDSDDSPVSRAASRDAPPDPKRPRLVDDPPDDATSSGRVRAFPHVDGNFATHVYIPVDIPRRPRAALARRLAALVALAPSLRPVGRDAPPDPTLDPDALVPDHLHVSLSRVFPIRIDARASLLAALRRALASLDAFHADVGPSFRVFLNDARDTAFVALDVSPRDSSRDRDDDDDRYDDRHDRFRAMVRAVDEALDARGYPTFYRRPVPHVSLLWCPGEDAAAAEKAVAAVAAFADPSRVGPGEGDARWTARVGRAACKVSGFPETTVWSRVEGLAPPEVSVPEVWRGGW